jgi:hypothetical protein
MLDVGCDVMLFVRLERKVWEMLCLCYVCLLRFVLCCVKTLAEQAQRNFDPCRLEGNVFDDSSIPSFIRENNGTRCFRTCSKRFVSKKKNSDRSAKTMTQARVPSELVSRFVC